MKSNFLKFGLIAFFALFYSLPALAQGSGGDEHDGEDPDPTPIDNWVLFLVLAGVAVGAYFIMKNRRQAIA